MHYETITYDTSEHIATVTLNRPDQLNSVDVTMIRELVDAFARVADDDDVRCAIVTGAGRAFCAGADLSKRNETFAVDRFAGGFDAGRDGARAVALAIYDNPKPFVAAINGSAVGFGLTLTLPMDIRVCADRAKLGFVFSRRGMVLDAAASWFLPRIVSLSQAAEWAYSGRMFDAGEAHRAGLVSELHPAGDVLPAARRIAGQIAAASPVSVTFTKALLWRGSTARSPHEVLDVDSAALRELGTTPDCAEGVTAFLERREPKFTGRVSTDMPAAYRWWERGDGPSDEQQIQSLIAAVSHHRDRGEFAEMAELFAHANFQTHYPPGYPGVGLAADEYQNRPAGGHGVQRGTDQVADIFRTLTKLYDGLPQTHYTVTNLSVDVRGDTATADSYYTAFQSRPDFPLQPIAAGRYHDAFERVEGRWRFRSRDIYADHTGDLSRHMTLDPIEYGRRFAGESGVAGEASTDTAR